MRQEYISLTTAIDMFEEYKRDETIIIKKPFFNMQFDGWGSPDAGKDLEFEFLKTQYSFLNFILFDRKIVLMGKNIKNNIMEIISETFLKNTWWDGTLANLSSSDACFIRNNYDYQNSYNASTNYDALYLNDEIIYTELCVKYTDFVELVRAIYKE